MGTPLYIISFFSFAAFNICSLCLIFVNLIYMCRHISLEFILYETLWATGNWVDNSFPILGKIFDCNLWKYFLMPFSLVFFFRDLYDLNVCSLNIVPDVSEIFLISFYSLFFILLCYSYSHHSFSSLIHSPASVNLLLVPSSVCLISVIVLFIADCLFFNTSQFSSVQFSHSVMSDSLQPHESQHARPPCPSPTPGVHPDSHPSSH